MPPPYTQIAVKFAQALVDADFALAASLLAPDLRREFTPELLAEHLHRMYEGYADGPPTSVHFPEEGVMEDWPTKQPGDLGWVYVGILGDDFVEAVAVIVSNIEDKPLIRDTQCGRPSDLHLPPPLTLSPSHPLTPSPHEPTHHIDLGPHDHRPGDRAGRGSPLRVGPLPRPRPWPAPLPQMLVRHGRC